MWIRFISTISIFTKKNIGVDMIPVDADFSKYKIVVAPVLYMVKDGMKEALENFVKKWWYSDYYVYERNCRTVG